RVAPRSRTRRPPAEVEPPAPLLPRPLSIWPEPIAIEVLASFPDGLPQRFTWAGVEQQVAHGWGPERIETGWWRGADVGRDYYVVETTTGERFWLFRTLPDGSWFLHGIFV